MQLCMSCQKEIPDGSIVHAKVIAIFKAHPSGELHGLNIIEDGDIVHEHCKPED